MSQTPPEVRRKKLSEAQLRMLQSTARYGDPWQHVHGGAAFGGAEKTMRSLREQLLIFHDGKKWRCSQRGRAELRKAGWK